MLFYLKADLMLLWFFYNFDIVLGFYGETSGDIWNPMSEVSYFWMPIEIISTTGIIDYRLGLI